MPHYKTPSSSTLVSKSTSSKWSLQSIALVICGILVVTLIYKWFVKQSDPLMCIEASANHKIYCVRKRKHLDKAANLLAAATENCTKVVNYLKHKHPTDPRVIQLVEKYDSVKITETLPTDTLTAYSENKGEKMSFCLNVSKDNEETELIDVHTLTFVALHEISHIMTTSVGHKRVFWENFKFVLENAKEANVHTPVDYKKTPKKYCSMMIHDNPFYDLN